MVRAAFRRYLTAPTAATVVVLAAGIAIVTAFDAFARRVILRPIPISASDRLLFVSGAGRTGSSQGLSLDQAHWFKEAVLPKAGVAAISTDGGTVLDGAATTRVRGEAVDDDYFRLLGVPIQKGRGLDGSGTFDGLDDAVISDRLWTSQFGRDPSIVGRVMEVFQQGRFEGHYDDVPLRLRVVGVTAAEFGGVGSAWAPTDYWYRLPAKIVETGLRGRRLPGNIQFVVLAHTRAEVDPLQMWLTRLGQQLPFQDSSPRLRVSLAVQRHPRAALPADRPVGASAPEHVASILQLIGAVALGVAVLNGIAIVVTSGLANESNAGIRMALGAGTKRLLVDAVAELSLTAAAGAGLGLCAGVGCVRCSWRRIRWNTWASGLRVWWSTRRTYLLPP